jgi:hypothetical protein
MVASIRNGIQRKAAACDARDESRTTAPCGELLPAGLVAASDLHRGGHVAAVMGAAHLPGQISVVRTMQKPVDTYLAPSLSGGSQGEVGPIIDGVTEQGVLSFSRALAA